MTLQGHSGRLAQASVARYGKRGSVRSDLIPILSWADTDYVDQVNGSERFPPGDGGSSRWPYVVLVALLGVDRMITLTWNVPLWSLFALVFLVIALVMQRVCAHSDGPPSQLRPLILASSVLAVVVSVLVLFSDTPSDRWLLLVWLVPASTALAEKFWPHLPSATLAVVLSCLVVLVLVGQLVVIWHAHTRHERASSFRGQLAQICTGTASRSSGQGQWIAANEWMIAQTTALAPPDQRTRELTAYLINALRQSEASLRVNDPVKQREWQQLAQQIAGDLGIGPSCGVF